MPIIVLLVVDVLDDVGVLVVIANLDGVGGSVEFGWSTNKKSDDVIRALETALQPPPRQLLGGAQSPWTLDIATIGCNLHGTTIPTRLCGYGVNT